MELARDLGLQLNYPQMEQEVGAAMATRAYGSYAADRRMQERLHGDEISRIGRPKAAEG